MPASPVLPKLVGARVKRREDPRLIRGAGTYVDDIALVGMQHLAFKRSDVAHGRIRSIDTSAAKAMEGVDSAIDPPFAKAEVVISPRMLNQRLAASAMEGRGVVAHSEPGKETMTIWSSTQNPHILRSFIAAMTGLGQDQVRAIATEVGGGFGAKINIYGEEYVAAAVSKRLGIPVKWSEDRSEAFVATTHGRDILGYVDLA